MRLEGGKRKTPHDDDGGGAAEAHSGKQRKVSENGVGAKASSRLAPRPLLDAFAALSDCNGGRRRAAVGRIGALCTDWHEYSVKRLVAGLLSPNYATRLGCANALVHLPHAVVSAAAGGGDPVQYVLQVASDKYQEDKNTNNGKIAYAMLYLSLLRKWLNSECMSEQHVRTIVSALCSLRSGAKCLDVFAANSIVFASEKLETDVWKEHVWPIVKAVLDTSLEDATAGDIHLALELKRLHPKAVRTPQLIADLCDVDVVKKNAAHLRALIVPASSAGSTVLATGAASSLLRFYARRRTAAALLSLLWRSVVAPATVHAGDAKWAATGCAIGEHLLAAASSGDHGALIALPVILLDGDKFWQSCVRLSSDAKQSKFANEHLRRLLQSCIECLETAKAADECGGTALRILRSAAEHAPDVDRMLNMRFVGRLVDFVDCAGLQQCINETMHSLRSDGASGADGSSSAARHKHVRLLYARLAKSAEFAGDADSVLSVWRPVLDCAVAERRLEAAADRRWSQTACHMLASHYIVSTPRPAASKAHIALADNSVRILRTVLAHLNGVQGVDAAAATALKAARKSFVKSLNAADGPEGGAMCFAVLFSHLALASLVEHDDTVKRHIATNLEELGAILGSVSSDGDWPTAVVDMLIQMLSHEQQHYRIAVQVAMHYLAPLLTESNVLHIFEALNENDSLEDSAQGDADVGNDDELSSASSDGSVSEGDTADGGSDASARGVNEQLVAKVTAALDSVGMLDNRSSGDDDNEDGSSTKSDLSDATMFRLDSALGNAFRARATSGAATGRAKAEAARQRNAFRMRLADALLLLLHSHIDGRIVLAMLCPLASTADRALREASQRNVYNRSRALLHMITQNKYKHMHFGDIAEVALGTFDAVVQMSTSVANPIVHAMLGESLAWMVRNGASCDGLLVRFEGALDAFATDRTSRLPLGLIETPISRHPATLLHLLPKLCNYAFDSSLRPYSRTEMLVLCGHFMRKDLVNAEVKANRKVWRRTVKCLSDNAVPCLRSALFDTAAATVEQSGAKLGPRFCAQLLVLLHKMAGVSPLLSVPADFAHSLDAALAPLCDQKQWRHEAATAAAAAQTTITAGGGAARGKSAQTIRTQTANIILKRAGVKAHLLVKAMLGKLECAELSESKGDSSLRNDSTTEDTPKKKRRKMKSESNE